MGRLAAPQFTALAGHIFASKGAVFLDTKLLEVVGQIAGIGGLSLGVLLLIFRDVIRKKIFPMLTKEQAYKLLKLLLILVVPLEVVNAPP